MRNWRIQNGKNLSLEEKEKRKEAARLRRQQKDHLRNRTPEGQLKAKYRILKYRYGLTKEQADILNQVTHCFICGERFSATILEQKPVTQNMPHVDHNHETGEVRGVLCGICNSFIGKIEAKQKDGTLEKIFLWIKIKWN